MFHSPRFVPALRADIDSHADQRQSHQTTCGSRGFPFSDLTVDFDIAANQARSAPMAMELATRIPSEGITDSLERVRGIAPNDKLPDSRMLD
jgi:hypothetical protein